MQEFEKYLNGSPTIFFKWHNSDNLNSLPVVTYATQNVNSLFDAKAEDFISGKIRYEDMIHPDDIKHVVKELAEYSSQDLDSYIHTPYRVKSSNGWRLVGDKTNILRNKLDESIEYHGYITDLTHLNKIETRLERSNSINELMHNALEMNYLISRSNINDDITYVNKKFCKVSGYSENELMGKAHNIFRHKSTPKSLYDTMWHKILNKQVWHGVMKNRKKDGGLFYIDATIIPVTNKSGKIIEFIAIRHEITQLVLEQEQHQKSLKTSQMFNLPNRASLLEDIKKYDLMSSALFDIDSFHEINDFYGYDIGDFVLKEFARTIGKQLGSRCKLYHLQSDQFVIHSNVEDRIIFEKKCLKSKCLWKRKTLV